jgi:4-hydroxy-4-methyl-2-oxoglutarate aldolase
MMFNIQDETVKQFKKLSTSAVSDAMDKLGMESACFGVAPLDSAYTMVGRAFTVKYEACGVEKGTVGDYIDDVKPGQIVVLDNAGRKDCTVWGDILTTVAYRKGIAGTVINGVCRDVRLDLDLQYPIFSLGKYMRTGKDRVQVDAVNVPITIGQIRVKPGDILMGDADGVVVVPQEMEEEVLSLAQQIESVELTIRVKVEQGMRLDKARQEYNYHKLQRG